MTKFLLILLGFLLVVALTSACAATQKECIQARIAHVHVQGC